MSARWHWISLLLTLNFFALPSWASEAELDSAVTELLAAVESEQPGIAVGLVRDGELVVARAVGLADLSFAIPLEIDTPMNIGSTGKQFTGYAVALLHERGQLSLDDDIRDYFPELPDFGETVTLRHLATHTSGYREFLNTLALAGVRIEKGDWIEQEEAIALILRQPELQNSPGAEWNYNNTGYVLLAKVIEQVTETPFADWLTQEVFEPLDMNATQVRSDPTVVLAGAARGYSKDGEEWREARDLGGAPGAGAVYTTVADMARWMKELGSFANGESAVGGMLTEPFEGTTYGLGLMIEDWRGQRRWQHGGGDLGHLSEFYYYPDLKAGVMVFANHHELPSGLVTDLTELLIGDALQDTKPEEVPGEPGAEFTDAFFDVLAGRYELEAAPGFVLRFFRDDDRYMIQATGQPAFEITPVDAQTFTIDVVDARIVFDVDEDGEVSSLTLFQNGEHRAVRLDEDNNDTAPPNRADFVGRYFSAELEAFYEVDLNEDELVLRHRRFGPIKLNHEGGDSFGSDFPITSVDFERDEDDQVIGLKAGNQRTRDVWFERVD